MGYLWFFFFKLMIRGLFLQVYHKQCFSCFECGVQLESTTVNDHAYGIYCGGETTKWEADSFCALFIPSVLRAPFHTKATDTRCKIVQYCRQSMLRAMLHDSICCNFGNIACSIEHTQCCTVCPLFKSFLCSSIG